MRCDECGAHNPDAAAWCNLCFHDLRHRTDTDTAPPGRATPERAPEEESDAATPSDGVVPARARLEPEEPEPGGPEATGGDGARSAPGAGSASSEGFRRRDGALEWQCPTCGQWAAIDEASCPNCGTPFHARLEADGGHGRGGRAAPPAGRTAVLNALLPGVGHLAAGWTGSGLARLVLYCVWVVGGIGLLGAGGTLVAFPLLLGAFVLWLTAVHDGWQLGYGGPQILNGRILLWLVVGVTVLAILGVAGAAVQST